VSTCGRCRHWAPILRDRNFLGTCIAPDRPNDRCTDRVDTCALFEPKETDNVVKGDKILEYLD
jgi:hypothetical protein